MNNELRKKDENSIVKLVNNSLDTKTHLEVYQKVTMYLHSENALDDILNKFKFIDFGNVYDHYDKLPIPDSVNMYDIINNFDIFQRIFVSEKINSAAIINSGYHHIHCVFFIDSDHLKKFSKFMKKVIQNENSQYDMFRGLDFKCKNGTYIELGSSMERDNPIEIIRKKIPREKLIFDKDSVISDVMNDINTFFKKETKKLYDKMQIPHKRGIILYGDPGNGKSAMIREIIRTVRGITKIIINPSVDNITTVLSMLIKALNGREAIIVIEDIDSLITQRNRSEFLNILDGVDIKSGTLFIGTTNYPERIDPAFINRSGRFDRSYKIDNPSDKVRRMFFESRDVCKLMDGYRVYMDGFKPVTDTSIVELCVKYSDGLPMATLKEIITASQYRLVSNKTMSIEEALQKTYDMLSSNRNDHNISHSSHIRSRGDVVPYQDGSIHTSKLNNQSGTVVLDYSRNDDGFIKLIKTKESNAS